MQREITNITINYKFKSKMGKFNYKEQHAVIVKCSSEDEQREIFEQLKKLGYKFLKLVSV